MMRCRPTRPQLFLPAILLWLAASGIPSAHAQERQRIAVLPFSPVGATPLEAETLHRDFQAGLAKTEVFFVISGEELDLRLAEEGYGGFGCTDERCAHDLGIQLQARQVVLGELRREQGTYTLSLKALDAPADRFLYLDRITAPSLEDMRAGMELAAYRLAGLVVSRRGVPEISRERTQILVETVPPRAEIYVNGVWRGSSPALLSRVPLGRITISAIRGNLYGETVVDTTQEVLQIRLELLPASGSLRIAAPENLDVYLDGQRLGKVRDGPFRNLAPGVFLLELKGGDLYWREHVQVPGRRLEVVEARPVPHGAIEFAIPEGAVAEVRGPMFRRVVRGYGVLVAPAGEYAITVAGSRYETREAVPLSVSPGATVAFSPRLEYTRDYQYARFLEDIQEAERSVAFGYRPSTRDLERFLQLRETVTGSKHDFPELVRRVESLIEKAGGTATLPPSREQPMPSRGEESGSFPGPSVESLPNRPPADGRLEGGERLEALLARRQELGLQLEARKLERRRNIGWGWASFGLAAVGGGLAGFFYYLGSEAYRDYETATTLDELLRAENEVKLWDAATWTAIGIGGVSLITSSVLWLSSPSVRDLQQELEALNLEIQELQDPQP